MGLSGGASPLPLEGVARVEAELWVEDQLGGMTRHTCAYLSGGGGLPFVWDPTEAKVLGGCTGTARSALIVVHGLGSLCRRLCFMGPGRHCSVGMAGELQEL